MSTESVVLFVVCACAGGFVGWFASLLPRALARSCGGVFDNRVTFTLVTVVAAALVGGDALQLFRYWVPAVASTLGCLAVGFWLQPRQWSEVSMERLRALLSQRRNGKSCWPEAQRKAARISYDTACACYRTKLYKLSAQGAREGIRTLLAPQLWYSPQPEKRKKLASVCPEQFKPHNRIAKYFPD